MSSAPDNSAWLEILKMLPNLGSAIFGMLGTYLMARRYAPQFFRSMMYALMWPLLLITGRGKQAHDFFKGRAGINWDVPENAAEMALGLNLLFWAFFLQLVAAFVE